MNTSTQAYVKANIREIHERMKLDDLDENDMEKIKQKLKDIVKEIE